MSPTTEQITRNGSAPVGEAGAGGVDLHLVTSPHWCVLDADELLEQLALAGYPAELIVTYQDPGGSRRYMPRYLRQNGRRAQAVAA